MSKRDAPTILRELVAALDWQAAVIVSTSVASREGNSKREAARDQVWRLVDEAKALQANDTKGLVVEKRDFTAASDKDIEDAEGYGRAAYLQGLTVAHNPHPVGSPLRGAWLQGYSRQRLEKAKR